MEETALAFENQAKEEVIRGDLEKKGARRAAF